MPLFARHPLHERRRWAQISVQFCILVRWSSAGKVLRPSHPLGDASLTKVFNGMAHSPSARALPCATANRDYRNLSSRFCRSVRNDELAQVSAEHLGRRVKAVSVKLKVGEAEGHKNGQPQLARYLSQHQGPPTEDESVRASSQMSLG